MTEEEEFRRLEAFECKYCLEHGIDLDKHIVITANHIYLQSGQTPDDLWEHWHDPVDGRCVFHMHGLVIMSVETFENMQH